MRDRATVVEIDHGPGGQVSVYLAPSFRSRLDIPRLLVAYAPSLAELPQGLIAEGLAIAGDLASLAVACGAISADGLEGVDARRALEAAIGGQGSPRGSVGPSGGSGGPGSGEK